MRGITDITVRLIRAARRAYTRKWSFLGLFAVAFFGSVVVLGWLDVLPEKKPPVVAALVITRAADRSGASGVTTSAPTVVELPMKIEIRGISLSTSIVNPTTTDIRVLDKELLSGAVRYPTSARLGESGNVVLFGHSSYLPVVKNQAYKAFNDIQKLSAGDVVTVSASRTAYTYKIRNVARESADNNTAIPLSVSGKVLTLVTCNSFGTKEDRFVVTADFVESYPVSI
ncbi:MAG: sortase [bacterium]|nr:sortase [bacterium]